MLLVVCVLRRMLLIDIEDKFDLAQFLRHSWALLTSATTMILRWVQTGVGCDGIRTLAGVACYPMDEERKALELCGLGLRTSFQQAET
jgi:hypothetical protein